MSNSKFELIILRFREILDHQEKEARKRIDDPYWSSGNTNVGEDKLAAVNLARTVKPLPEEFIDASGFVTSLIIQLLTLKKSYERVYEDFDGYGAATFQSIISKLTEFSNSIDAPPTIDPSNYDCAKSTEPEIKPEGNAEINRGVGYDVERDIDNSLFGIRAHIQKDDYLLALDYAQIHLLFLAIDVYGHIEQITPEEVLFYSRRLRQVRSIFIDLLFREKMSLVVVRHSYRYIAAATGLLRAITEFNRSRVYGKKITHKLSELPVLLFALSSEKAKRGMRNKIYASPVYDADMPHLQGYQHLISLQKKMTDDDELARFLAYMFEDPLRLFGKPEWSDFAFIHYVTAEKVSNDVGAFKPLSYESAPHIFRFILRRSHGSTDIQIVDLGPYKTVEILVENLLEATSHAVLFGKDLSGGDLERDLKLLSNQLFQKSEHCFSDQRGLLFISEGLLSVVPYNALFFNSPRHLLQDYDIILSGDYRWLNKDRDFCERDLSNGVIIANPDFDLDLFEGTSSTKEETQYGFQMLTEAECECDEILSIYDWSCYRGSGATKSNLIKALKSACIVHVATHGVFEGNLNEINLVAERGNPGVFFERFQELMSKSSVVLSGANRDHDKKCSRVNIDDISKLDLSELRLVFLSLCVGRTGGVVSGETAFSIARGMLDSGAHLVIASSLPVNDNMSREISVAFYSFVRDGLPAESALRKAQLSCLASGAHWYAWAGFQVLI